MLCRCTRSLSLVLFVVGAVGCTGSGELDPQEGVLAIGPDGLPAPSLPAAAGAGYRLPWACGESYLVTQGNHGDLCGDGLGNHTGVEEYAWDFGLPMRTPVLAARAGVITLAATYSPPGSECYSGCPYDLGTAQHDACCARCSYSANRVNMVHENGEISSYSHFDEVLVRAGKQVAAGELLGYSGTTGCSTGPHLHFQIMTGCPAGYCQSLPLTFDEAGRPACGKSTLSHNRCE